MQQKSELMARMRESRRKAGLVRIEFWLTTTHAEQVRRYVARITKEKK